MARRAKKKSTRPGRAVLFVEIDKDLKARIDATARAEQRRLNVVVERTLSAAFPAPTESVGAEE